MLEMLRDLIAHKGHANAQLLEAIASNPGAAADPELSDLLHHILLANRFWLCSVQSRPFVLEDEMRRSPTLPELGPRYEELRSEETAWIASTTETDLERILEDPRIPGGKCSVGQAIMQVCMHSHGHRAQCAKILRRHGTVPPPSDFILWLPRRPEG